jgi:hypothetical protein
MTEAAGGGRAEMERKLLQRGLEGESFRQTLLADPRTAIEDELGTRLPEDTKVVAVEQTSDTIYLVLPPATSRATEQGEDELSDRELAGVAGGGTWSTCQGVVKAVQWC